MCIDCKDEQKINRKIKNVLCLDGGGIRCIFQVVILQMIALHNNTCLCKMFDLVVGNSFGGVVATIIANSSKTSMKSLFKDFFDIKTIKELAPKSMFDKITKYYQLSPIYDGKGKNKVLEKYFMNNFNDLSIPCVVTTYNIQDYEPMIFCSWKHGYRTSKILGATTSPPTIYPPVKINEKYYCDGGVAINNPTSIAYNIANEKFTDFRILSIGTGKYKPKWNNNVPDWGGIQWIMNGLIDLMANAPNQIVEKNMNEKMGNKLLRLDNDNIGNIYFDEYNEKNLKLLKTEGEISFHSRKKEIKNFLDL